MPAMVSVTEDQQVGNGDLKNNEEPVGKGEHAGGDDAGD
jgi:hypothetical protein